MRLLNLQPIHNGSHRNAYAIVDDTLATMIRRNFNDVIIDNVDTVEQFATAITPYVGNPLEFRRYEFDYSFNEDLDPTNKAWERLDFVKQLFPNMHYHQRSSTVAELDYFSLFEKQAALKGANYMMTSIIVPTTEYITALTYSTWFVNGYSRFNFIIPVLFESEVENDVIHRIPASGTYRWLSIAWQKENSWEHGRVVISQSSNIYSSNSTSLNYFEYSIIPEPEPPGPSEDDPYGPDSGGPGYSTGGGGPAGTGGTGATGTGGLHDDTSDPIPIPIPPTDVITSAGLITAYNPSASQLADFANKLWNGDPTTIGDWFRLLFGGDAFNAIIGIHLLPVSPATSGSPVHIKLGNWDTEAEAPKITNQYVQHTFGTLMLPEYWGNCIDYAPYTKIQLALPYIGIVDVDTDDVLGSENTLTYNIDVYSGALCAMLRCIKGNLSSVIYQWSGSCGVSIPITGADKSAILSTVVAGSVVTGAAGAIGGVIGAVAANAALAGTAASSYGTMKGKVQKQGTFSPNAGAMGIMTPYFILTRPVQSVPSSWQADKGYPANISAQLGTLTGYTEVSEINLECSGTEAEKKEIIDLLKKGVIF